MADSNPKGEIAVFGAFLRCLVRHAGPRLWAVIGLLAVTGALESARLLLIFPLLASIGVGRGAMLSKAGQWGTAALLRIHLPATPLVVLSIFVLVTIGQAVLRAYTNSLSLQVETGFTSFLRERFYRAMVRADWLFLSRQRASDLTQTLMGELRAVGGVTQTLLNLAASLATTAARVAVALWLSPLITLFALASGAALAWGLRKLRARVMALGESTRAMNAEMAAAVTEHLAGLKIAKSHGREAHHLNRFRRAMDRIAAQTLRVYRLNAAAGIWRQSGSVIGIAIFLAFAISVAHVSSSRLLVLAYIFTGLQGIQASLQASWQGIFSALPSFAAAEKTRSALLAAAEAPEPENPVRIPLAREIVLENVSFRYDPARPEAAVHGLSLIIPAREVIALCGPSGAGKSTTADLVLGLLTPTGGRVLVDGQPLAGDRVHNWRQSIGYVPQETFLFNDTVRANLLWARPEATEEDLLSALRMAAAERFVDKLPLGWDTLLGDRGVRLSGGERQRIALARAILRRPSLLVLDEATSSLDTENERLIQDAIEGLRGEVTILIIAHRLSTVRVADRIAVLREGRLVESGSWDELAARERGAFKQLLTAGELD
jgi:ATP-binding cassette subfamily C protein